MKKTLITLALFASTSTFANTINCVLTNENYVKVTGNEIAVNNLQADGNARVIVDSFYGETWIVSALNVGDKGDVIVSASKLAESPAIANAIMINNQQPALNVSIKMDGTLSAGKTVKSTQADMTHHLFCEVSK